MICTSQPSGFRDPGRAHQERAYQVKTFCSSSCWSSGASGGFRTFRSWLSGTRGREICPVISTRQHNSCCCTGKTECSYAQPPASLRRSTSASRCHSAFYIVSAQCNLPPSYSVLWTPAMTHDSKRSSHVGHVGQDSTVPFLIKLCSYKRLGGVLFKSSSLTGNARSVAPAMRSPSVKGCFDFMTLLQWPPFFMPLIHWYALVPGWTWPVSTCNYSSPYYAASIAEADAHEGKWDAHQAVGPKTNTCFFTSRRWA